MRHQSKYRSRERERKVDTAYHKKKMWEGCAAGFVIEDALRGNDRKPTDIICFLSTVSSILLSLDIEKKTVSRTRKHFERETKK